MAVTTGKALVDESDRLVSDAAPDARAHADVVGVEPQLAAHVNAVLDRLGVSVRRC